MIRAFLDLNVLLDFSLAREPWWAEADAIWRANAEGRIEALISSASLPTVYYLARKPLGPTAGLRAVAMWAGAATIVPVDSATIQAALVGAGPDFEDNLQLACALRAGADVLVTRDPRGFPGAPLPVLSPADFLSGLPPAPAPADPTDPEASDAR